MEYKDIEKLVNEAETLYQIWWMKRMMAIILDCHLKFSRPGKLLKMTLRENWWRRCLCISQGGSLRNILKNV